MADSFIMAKPQFEFIPTGESRALVYKIDRDLWPVYHYHPEYDILLSLKDHAGGIHVRGSHRADGAGNAFHERAKYSPLAAFRPAG